METINVTKSMVEINDLCFGEVTIFCNEYCLHLYNSKGWICMISFKDIITFNSSDPNIDSEVNKFILEQISK